jgi:hypothetical protein
MKIKFSLLLLVLLSFNATSAQDTMFSKQCRIAAGYGFGNGVQNTSAGSTIFLQLNYQLSSQFSLATEFDNVNYKAPGNFPALPPHLNTQNYFDNYFSLLIKYHLPIKSKLNTSLASGWTFYTRQQEYYEYYKDANGERITYQIYSFSDFGIPFLLETFYPVWKKLSAGVRLKYNLNPGNGSTYSAGVGVSLGL